VEPWSRKPQKIKKVRAREHGSSAKRGVGRRWQELSERLGKVFKVAQSDQVAASSSCLLFMQVGSGGVAYDKLERHVTIGFTRMQLCSAIAGFALLE
jgi:hypothetical protein